MARSRWPTSQVQNCPAVSLRRESDVSPAVRDPEAVANINGSYSLNSSRPGERMHGVNGSVRGGELARPWLVKSQVRGRVKAQVHSPSSAQLSQVTTFKSIQGVFTMFQVIRSRATSCCSRCFLVTRGAVIHIHFVTASTPTPTQQHLCAIRCLLAGQAGDDPTPGSVHFAAGLL